VHPRVAYLCKQFQPALTVGNGGPMRQYVTE